MASVWIIEQGEYSDYRVVGIFSSEENAKKGLCVGEKESICGYEASIRQVPLDPCIEELNQGLTLFFVRMEYDGKATCNRDCNINDSAEVLSVNSSWGPGFSDWIAGHVWAKDETHAIKIASEYRRQAIAEGRMQHSTEKGQA